jgi:hypothetical protein
LLKKNTAQVRCAQVTHSTAERSKFTNYSDLWEEQEVLGGEKNTAQLALVRHIEFHRFFPQFPMSGHCS